MVWYQFRQPRNEKPGIASRLVHVYVGDKLQIFNVTGKPLYKNAQLDQWHGRLKSALVLEVESYYFSVLGDRFEAEIRYSVAESPDKSTQIIRIVIRTIEVATGFYCSGVDSPILKVGNWLHWN